MENCIYLDINKYSEHVQNFMKIYKHFNNCPIELVSAFIGRWLILRAFQEEYKYDKVFHLDSDIMLYCDITEENNKHFSKYEDTISMNLSGHCSFITYKYVSEFCKYLYTMYENNVKEIENHYLYYFVNNGFCPGGICDMFHLRNFCNSKVLPVEELDQILDNSIFDHNLEVSQNFQMNNITHSGFTGKIKKIFWKNNMPYGIYKDGREIRFNTLHFQGNKKALIPGFVNEQEYNQRIKSYLSKIEG